MIGLHGIGTEQKVVVIDVGRMGGSDRIKVEHRWRRRGRSEGGGGEEEGEEDAGGFNICRGS
jgi:hypothetical protein